MEAITIPAGDTTLAFFGGGKEECFHCMDCRLVSGIEVVDPTLILGQHSSWVRERDEETGLICFQKCQVRLLPWLLDRPGVLLARR